MRKKPLTPSSWCIGFILSATSLMMAAASSTHAEAMSHVRSEISNPNSGPADSKSSGRTSRGWPFACWRAADRCRLRARLVEAVLTCSPDLLEPLEERLVQRDARLPQLRALRRPDDDVLDPVHLDERRRVGAARVDSLHLRLAPLEVEPVRPDVAGVSEKRAAPGKVNGVIIDGRVQNQSARRSLTLYQLGEGEPVGVYLAPLRPDGR